MGTFTSIIHPDDGRKLQIYSGIDDCETYRVGDTVNWFVSKDYPRSGKLLDGVYDSYDDDWVVIKDHKVHAVVPRTDNGYGDYEIIKSRFGIQDLPDSAWSEKGWARKRELDAKLEKEQEEFEESIKHLPPHKRFAAVLARPISRMLNYEGIARKILDIEPLE